MAHWLIAIVGVLLAISCNVNAVARLNLDLYKDGDAAVSAEQRSKGRLLQDDTEDAVCYEGCFLAPDALADPLPMFLTSSTDGPISLLDCYTAAHAANVSFFAIIDGSSCFGGDTPVQGWAPDSCPMDCEPDGKAPYVCGDTNKASVFSMGMCQGLGAPCTPALDSPPPPPPTASPPPPPPPPSPAPRPPSPSPKRPPSPPSGGRRSPPPPSPDDYSWPPPLDDTLPFLPPTVSSPPPPPPLLSSPPPPTPLPPTIPPPPPVPADSPPPPSYPPLSPPPPSPPSPSYPSIPLAYGPPPPPPGSPLALSSPPPPPPASPVAQSSPPPPPASSPPPPPDSSPPPPPASSPPPPPASSPPPPPASPVAQSSPPPSPPGGAKQYRCKPGVALWGQYLPRSPVKLDPTHTGAERLAECQALCDVRDGCKGYFYKTTEWCYLMYSVTAWGKSYDTAVQACLVTN